jgi:polar amino acid transport system ATP-binding protein
MATTLDIVALLRSVQERGVTMVIASHDLDFLIQIADRIVLLKKGLLVENINPKDIQDPIGHLKALY